MFAANGGNVKKGDALLFKNKKKRSLKHEQGIMQIYFKHNVIFTTLNIVTIIIG